MRYFNRLKIPRSKIEDDQRQGHSRVLIPGVGVGISCRLGGGGGQGAYRELLSDRSTRDGSFLYASGLYSFDL